MKRVFYVPGCGAVTPALLARLSPEDVLFFDGALWRDDEMVLAGTGTKTGNRMGHISISDPDGSLAAFAGVTLARKVYLHINNTNPILYDDSAQAAEVRAAGWEIGFDGIEISV